MLIYAGLKIHSWTIISKLPDNRKTKSVNLKKRVRAECVCGVRETLPTYYLTRKSPAPKKSCGCLNKGLPTQHPLEYRVWHMMNVRCTDPNHVSYKSYGGAGIEVCDRWKRSNPHGFANFLKDMGPRGSVKMTLDRIDPYGPYAPEWKGKPQTRWATWTEQANNKKSNHPVPPPPEIEQEEQLAKDLTETGE
jgi:hypothetical protein